jgi:exopolyphosphatase / guanosine-5'-triphosphate,3'-diphosphate pyrophosphatase
MALPRATPFLVHMSATQPASIGERDANRRAAGATRIAAIDVGSNSIRQIVADVSPDGGIAIVDEMKAAPRLGAGLDATGRLADMSMARAVDALRNMAVLAKKLDANKVVAVATSAVRDAENAAEFVARVKSETGLVLRVLTGEDEARLTYRSAVAHFELGNSRTAMVDLGGGSLELALSFDGIVDRLMSLPLGAVRLTERFFASGDSEKRLRALRKHARRVIRDNVPTRPWRGARLIGAGGTFTNLAGIILSRQGMESAKSVQGAIVARTDVEHVLDTLAGMSVEERRKVPGLNEGRADIIVAGLAVIAELMARLEVREVAVSRYGIREGLLLETARVAPTVADPGEARARSVQELAQRCHADLPHANQVRTLALRLFDALGERLGCEPEDRHVLADAALLHDIGYHISYERHHKHSYHLIVHAELLGVAPVDQVSIANIARYHRGTHPRKKHKTFGELEKPVRRRIRRLAAILRLADGLDRGHLGAVADVRVRWMPRAIRITLVPRSAKDPLQPEVRGAHHKSELLAEISGVPVEIITPDREVFSSEKIAVDE